MKGEDVFNALSDVNDEMLEECEQKNDKPHIRTWTKWVSAAAALLVVGAGTLTVLALNGKFQTGVQSGATKDKETYSVTTTVTATQNSELEEKSVTKDETTEVNEDYDVSVVTPWNVLNNGEKYNCFFIDEADSTALIAIDNYYFFRVAIDSTKIGENVGRITLESVNYDDNTDTYADVELYTVNGIAKEAALAVKFDGDDNYYVYTNDYYNPSTLGEFVDGLNLGNDMTIGNAFGEYVDNQGLYTATEYIITDSNDVKNRILQYRDAKCVEDYDSADLGTDLLQISINDETIGANNLSFTITDKGYLTTNIMQTGRAYYIGSESAYDFVNYIYDNYKASEITYDDSETIVYDENNTTDESVTENSVVTTVIAEMTTENY